MKTRFNLGNPVQIMNLDAKNTLDGVISAIHSNEHGFVSYDVRLTHPGWSDHVFKNIRATFIVGADGLIGGDDAELIDPTGIKTLDYDEGDNESLPDLEVMRIAMERLRFKRDGSIYRFTPNPLRGYMRCWLEFGLINLQWVGDKKKWDAEMSFNKTANGIVRVITKFMKENAKSIR